MERRSIREVFLVALRLGLTSFGGPIAHIGYFRREYVERRRWVDEAEFADLLALCQALPGPASSELGIAIGTRRAGITGGVAAWVGFTLPSACVLVLFGLLSQSVDLATSGWVHGLKLAAVAVVAQAVHAMARTLTPDWPRRILAALAAVVGLAWPSAFAQIAAIVGGALLGRLLLVHHGQPGGPRETGAVSKRAGAAALIAFASLLLGLPLLRLGVDGQALALFDGFFRTGALVFGGGHVVLPLLHATVVDPGWLTDDQFLAGYGAAQAVPGPLFTFAAYLGTISALPPNGWIGAAIALAGIFLPGFLLVWGTLPFWDALRTRTGFRRALAGTNAAVVGILAAALYQPVWTSAVTRPLDAAIAGLGLTLLLTRRVPPIVVVGVSAMLGHLAQG